MRVDARRDALRLEMAAVGELPVLVRDFGHLDRGVDPDDLQGGGKAVLRLVRLRRIRKIDLHLRRRLLDVVIRRQDEVVPVEDLEDRIDVTVVDLRENLDHKTLP